MAVVCGVYGYQITRSFEVFDLTIEPRTTQYQQAKEWALDSDCYNLTAVIKADSASDDLLFNLAGLLSFIEHLDVLLAGPVPATGADPFQQFPERVATKRHRGGGAIIGDDTVLETRERRLLPRDSPRWPTRVFATAEIQHSTLQMC